MHAPKLRRDRWKDGCMGTGLQASKARKQTCKGKLLRHSPLGLVVLIVVSSGAGSGVVLEGHVVISALLGAAVRRMHGSNEHNERRMYVRRKCR